MPSKITGPGQVGKLIFGGPPPFNFKRGYLSDTLDAPESLEERTTAPMSIWGYNDDNEWVPNPLDEDQPTITIVNHDMSLTGEAGAFVIVMEWLYTKPDGSKSSEWVPIWVGCATDG